MAINFNANPYYDDYDQTKGFHRILFKPGVAVQARELTQLQTILNNQITQFGNHVFVDGSLVIPGQAALDVEYYSVKVVENTTLVANFIGEIVVGGTTGIKAKVINATEEDADGNPATLFIKYINSGTNGTTKTFANSETITVDGGSAYVTAITPVLPETSATYTGTAYTITAGVMYVKGNFVYFPQQTYIISKYGRANNVIVGFDIEESIKSYSDDNTLLDPAQGSYNYSAPGADRYFIGLTLAERELTSNVSDDENFVELIRIQSYKVISQKRQAQYNFLADEFARRTYDESGDYVVRPYNLKLLEHSEFYRNITFNSGEYSGQTGDDGKIIAKVSPGKAYVKGYEVDSIQSMIVPFNKARDTQDVNSGTVFLPIGNYTYVDTLDNIPADMDTDIPLVNLKDSTAGTGNTIGIARLRFLQYSSGTIGTSGAVYKAYLFDVSMNADEVFASVQSITDGSFTADTVLESGNAVIKEPLKKSYIFPMPRSYIESIVSNETILDVFKVYQAAVSAGKTITITAPTDTVFSSQSNDNYQVINITDGTHYQPSSLTFTPSAPNLTITVSAAAESDEIIVIAKLRKTNSAANSKAKTLQSNQTIDKTSQADCEATTISLGKADIYRLVSVKMTTGAAFGSSYDASVEIDITDRYTLDNGQRVSYYGLGSVTLKKGKAKPTNPIRITYDYFTHGAGNYFSVESYSSIDYADIPTVTFDGIDYALSDCLDFRPRINDAGTGFSGTGGSLTDCPEPGSALSCDYAFYLPKITKIIIDKDGNLRAIDGQSSLEPKEPPTPDNAMALYVLTQDPYVFDLVDNIRIKKIDNRRYTMRDIGNLESRIKNVEYYVALNLLELDAQQYQIQDSSGNDLFKNGFVVDSFTGHGVGDVYTTDYACSIDKEKRILRPQSDVKFYELLEVNTTDGQRTSDGYKLAGDLILMNYASEEAFVTNTKFSETLTLNPYNMITHVGVITGKQTDIWKDYKKAPDVTVNDNGDYDSMLKEAAVLNKNGTLWGNWVTREIRDDQGRVIESWEERSGSSSTYSVNYSTTTKSVKEEIDSSIISKMRDTTIDFSAAGLKPSTRLYVFFDGINVTRDCKPITGSATSDIKTTVNLLGDTAEDIITDADGEITMEFKYSSAKYNLNTGDHLLRLSDSPSGNIIEESTSASMIFTSYGETITTRNKIISTRVPTLVSSTSGAGNDIRNKKTFNYADDPDLAGSNYGGKVDIVPAGESTETLLDSGLVQIDTVVTSNTANGDGTYTTTQNTVTTVIDPIVIAGHGSVYIEPIVDATDPDYPVDHTGYNETSFLFVKGRYPDQEEKARLDKEAANRGISNDTIANATFTDGTSVSGSHNYVVDNGRNGISVVDGNGDIIWPDPSSYNDEAKQLFLYTKDLAKSDYENLDGNSSAVAHVMNVLGCGIEKASSIVALQAVIGTLSANSLDDDCTFKDGALAASTGI